MPVFVSRPPKPEITATETSLTTWLYLMPFSLSIEETRRSIDPFEKTMAPPSTRAIKNLLFAFVLALPCISAAGAHRRKNTAGKGDIIDGPLLTSSIPTNRSIIVGPSEEFTTVQEAIDAVPEGNRGWIIVHLRAGIYREKVVIPRSKEYVFLRGNGKGRTAIVWGDSSDNNTLSATFAVWADHFVAFGISFKNEASVGAADSPFNQSAAAIVAGDKAAFYHCAFFSSNNTLFDYKGRHYYESCYIQGNIDFIFGRGQSIYQSCEIFVLQDKRKEIVGSITAQNRKSSDENGGFVFLNGSVYGVGEVFLGRAKGAHSRVVFAKTYLSRTVTPRGWTNWSYVGTTDNLLYGEHECHGPGSESTSRVPWSKQLSEEEASPFMSINFIDGQEWLPAYY